MSIINKMLQDLDRRSAIGAGSFELSGQQVRAVASPAAGREWFWRTVALLVLIALVWVGWVAYQLQPRPLATDQAHAAAAKKARQRPIVQPPPAPEPVTTAPEPVASVSEPVASVSEPVASVSEPVAPKPAAPPPPRPQTSKPKPQPKAVNPPPLPVEEVLDKRERVQGAHDVAEGHFRRAAQLLGQGRVSEAQAELTRALQADPTHAAARQAYVALLLEHQRFEAAETLLREGVSLHPSHSPFTLALARIHAGRSEYQKALDVMETGVPHGVQLGALSGISRAEHHALRGALLQRLERHADAVAAYQQAVQEAPQPAGTWTGLAISLEALGRAGDAAQAYRHALEARPLPRELQDYAEARLRALAR